MAANSSIISVNCSLVLLAYSAIFSASGGQVRANEPYDDDQTSAGWAWARIKQGKEADFNIRCEDSPIQLRADAIPWADRCRIISGNVLVDLLTKSSLHDQVPFSGIKIANARITGEIDLQNAKFDRALTVVNSVIEGDINLTAARSASVVAFVESKIEGNFNAWQFRSDLSLDLSSTEFKQDIMLNDAVINGYLSTQTAIIGGKLNAGTLQVGGNLFMRSAKLRGSVVLNGAKIGGNIYADGASFDENIDADSLVIGASLSVRSLAEQKANFKSANLSNARIGGSIQMDGATFSDSLTADALQVGVSLFMQSTPDHQAVFKAISLKSARITGNLDLDGAWLQGDVVADSLQVGGSLVMRSARHNSSLIFIGAKIGNNLEMSNSAFGKLILTGASVMRNFIAEGVFLTGDFDANALQVGASLFMGATSKSKGGFRRININGARISGDLVFNGAMLQGAVNANSLQVGGAYRCRMLSLSHG
jgi:cytoskeletal protein CcmA (bactofilin family)